MLVRIYFVMSLVFVITLNQLIALIRVYYHTQNCSPACNPYLGIAQLATEYKRVKSAALATKHHKTVSDLETFVDYFALPGKSFVNPKLFPN